MTQMIRPSHTEQGRKALAVIIMILRRVHPFILGLLLRKPCIKIIAFFNKKAEESDPVI